MCSLEITGSCVHLETGKGFNPIDQVLDEDAKPGSERFYRYASIKCFQWVPSGGAYESNLSNTCDDNLMATVLHAGEPGPLKYRLPRKRGRLIRTPGLNSIIVNEGPWDFGYGDDVAEYIQLLREELRNGQIRWSLSNHSGSFVCFKAPYDRRARKEHGYSYGIVGDLSP